MTDPKAACGAISPGLRSKLPNFFPGSCSAGFSRSRTAAHSTSAALSPSPAAQTPWGATVLGLQLRGLQWRNEANRQAIVARSEEFGRGEEGRFASGVPLPSNAQSECSVVGRNLRNLSAYIAEASPSDSSDSGPVPLDLLQEIRGTARSFQDRAETLKEAVVSIDYEVKPTPYTPIEGDDAVQFALVCIALFLAFWVGNYLAPDLIFRNTVFKKEEADEFSTPASGTLPKGNEQAVSNLQSRQLNSESSETDTAPGQNSTDMKAGVGFGRGSASSQKSSERR